MQTSKIHFHIKLWILCVLIGSFSITPQLYGQLGPGGVSHESPNTLSPTQSDVRLWLDAGSLTSLADGDDVVEWDDISFSSVNDKGFRESSDPFLAPFYRDDPSASINGHPVVTFENGRMLKINTSTDLNSSNSVVTTYTQTIILAFRTSEDVSSRQTLWEEGGSWRGMNIFIYNGELYLGAYDDRLDNDIGWGIHGKIPKFGYNYVKTPVQPNTTYVISHIFDAPRDNSLNGSIKGYRNGSYFGTLINSGHENSGIGGIWKHTDPIGIGATNSDTYNETGPQDNITGLYSFKGRLAEICYYSRLLNDAERIIIENYLGAKYYANIIVNDRYEYQSIYGYGVVGIGQTLNDPDYRHTVSQGYNPFEISAVNESLSYNTTNEFLLAGHNGLPLDLTDLNVPNDSGSTRRTERIWRFDESQNLSTIKFRFHSSDLLPLSSGFTKHVLIFDDNSVNFPNFSTENATVVELLDVGDGYYEATKDIVDGSFMTLGILKPQASFKLPENFALESDPAPDSTLFFDKVYVRLNYVPQSPVKVDFSFTDMTATRADDYGYMNSAVSNGITFPTGLQEVPVLIWVKNDVIQEDPSTESFAINLQIGPNTTSGLGLGNQSQHIFTIYDNDPPPKLSFAQATNSVLESAGTVSIEVVRTGSTVGTASARIRLKPASTTATANEDFTYPSTYKTISFANGESVKSVTVDINQDLLDENDETIRFQLYSISGAGSDASSILEHNLTIVDDDLPPTVEFTSAVSQNFETNGTPQILIELDNPSAKEVQVTYTKRENLATAATYETDYGLTFPATITIAPGDTLGYPIGFIVQQDGVAELDETVELELTSSSNATLGVGVDHVFTIKDYSTFEWKGVAGVGKAGDNIFWLDIDKQSGTHNSTLQNITNFSPHNINVSQSNNSYRAKLQVSSNTINDRKTLKFDGNDIYVMDNTGVVNMAPTIESKGYFFVMRTGTDVNGWQTIYKQGGSSRGFSIYIKDGSMYFNAWNNPSSDPGDPWGSGTSGLNQDKYARIDGLIANTNYVVSCLFDKNNAQRIRIYVNGQLGERVETGLCGTMYPHSGEISIGGASGDAKYHDNSTSDGRYFKGSLAEMIHFHDAPISEVRRKLLENYFAGKYNIPLVGDMIYDLPIEFSHEIAGIGKLNNSAGETHTDSQGPLSILRIKSPSTLNNNSYLMWGHNNVALDESWPWSGGNLPTGIVERSGRVWAFSKTGTVGGLEVLLRYQTLLNAADFSVNDLKLLIHQNTDAQDFSGATVVNASELLSGNVVKFTGVNISDGAYFALANSSTINPLPIELLDFNAKLEGKDVRLNWSTASETNNENFIVERAGEDLRFEPILSQSGAGNSNTILFYSDIDPNPLQGVSYYRLKQVDFDGEFEYSDPVSIFIQPKIETMAFRIYPNPNHDKILNIHKEGSIRTDENILIEITNMTGSNVYQTMMPPDIQSKTIHLPSSIRTGLYLIRFSNQELDKTYKLVISN